MLWSLQKDIKSLGKPKRLYTFHDICVLKRSKDEPEADGDKEQ